MTITVFVVIMMMAFNLFRGLDNVQSYRVWKKLSKGQLQTEKIFFHDSVRDLPIPARQYFEYMIKDGTPLRDTAIIHMTGQLGLGPQTDPDYMAMTAKQIMRLPQGFIWAVNTGRGPMVVTGSDGFYQDKSWSRFWLMHSLPLGRAGGNSKRRLDHRRAAFGRLVAEAAFWTPAALLPSDAIVWDAVNDSTVRATVTYQELVQSVDIHLTPEGQPYKVTIQRWSDSNPSNRYQLQPFGGFLSDFKNFEGYQLPTHVEGGNFIGTNRYFPFYIAEVESISFLTTSH